MDLPKQAYAQGGEMARHSWACFMQAHREAIEATPTGGVVVLLNSDIVVSKETFTSVNRIFANPAVKVSISVGIRTLIDGNVPPVGADAETLAKWIWEHQHPITKDCVWGRGHSRHPTILFFEHDGGVSMHCFHQTPMFIRKDRHILFKGTIDDDLLERYQAHELYYMCNREAIFAELSPAWKKHATSSTPLNVEDILEFGKRKFRKSHVRNFMQRFTLLGSPSSNHPAADQIIGMLPK